jgi:NADPH2 dehydrogenase
MAAKLFEPYTIKDLVLKNRIVMSPMCMYSAEPETGLVNNWHLTHYTSRAVGQVGLIIVEVCEVSRQGLGSPGELGIWDDAHIPGLAKLVELCHEHGSKIGVQIGHSGRKAYVDGPIIAPSPIPFDEKSRIPQEMTREQIGETVEAFRKAAVRARKAGFDVLELHAAHGYLINEFLSPLTNHRTDEYGGSRENRYRFLREIIDAVTEVWEGPLFVRISANEFHPEGSTLEDHVYYALRMKEQGVDLIDCSAGGVVPAKVDAYPGYEVPYAEYIRREAGIPTGAVGLITSPLHAEEIVRNGRADLVFLGRELLRDPYWPYRAARELKAELEVPAPYRRGWLV